MNNEWRDAQKWANAPTLPPLMIGGIYAGFLVFGLVDIILEGKWRLLTDGCFLGLVAWGLFAVLLSWYLVATVHRARKHIQEHRGKHGNL